MLSLLMKHFKIARLEIKSSVIETFPFFLDDRKENIGEKLNGLCIVLFLLIIFAE